MFSTLTILAPGLLGASLGMAAHERRLAERIVVWARRAEGRAACLAAGWCDSAPADPAEAAAEGDLVVLCPPVEHLLPLLETIAPTLRPGTLVTDVGSTKGTICAGADRLMPAGAHFVGAHPMAGSEKSGMEHARADLFAGRPCFLTPTVATDAAATERVERFWQAVGMRTLRETPARHDFTVAHVSHLPHLLASALSVALGRQNGSDAWPAVAGAGLRDTTRVAAGHPGLWRDICAQNRPALQSALGDFRHALTAFEEALEREDFDTLEALLAEGRAYRQRFDPPPA